MKCAYMRSLNEKEVIERRVLMRWVCYQLGEEGWEKRGGENKINEVEDGIRGGRLLIKLVEVLSARGRREREWIERGEEGEEGGHQVEFGKRGKDNEASFMCLKRIKSIERRENNPTEVKIREDKGDVEEGRMDSSEIFNVEEESFEELKEGGSLNESEILGGSWDESKVVEESWDGSKIGKKISKEVKEEVETLNESEIEEETLDQSILEEESLGKLLRVEENMNESNRKDNSLDESERKNKTLKIRCNENYEESKRNVDELGKYMVQLRGSFKGINCNPKELNQDESINCIMEPEEEWEIFQIFEKTYERSLICNDYLNRLEKSEENQNISNNFVEKFKKYERQKNEIDCKGGHFEINLVERNNIFKSVDEMINYSEQQRMQCNIKSSEELLKSDECNYQNKYVNNIENLMKNENRICCANAAIEVLLKDRVNLNNIESITIVEGDIQHVLNFIWLLVLHYSIKIQLPTKMNDEEHISNEFLKWLNSKIRNFVVNNFSSDWNNGLALGALIRACYKDSCTDVYNWDINNSLMNLNIAMEKAVKYLGIESWITPEEMVDAEVSERVIMTYISQFIELLNCSSNMKQNRKSKGLERIEDVYIDTKSVFRNTNWNMQIRENGIIFIHEDVHILITNSCNKSIIDDNLIVEVRDPNGVIVSDCKWLDSELNISFTPKMAGIYKFSAYENAIEIETFNIYVQDKKDELKMIVYGPGLFLAPVGHAGVFILETKGSDRQIGIAIEGPGKTDIKCLDLNNGIIKVSYTTYQPGIYELYITANEVNICNSPHFISVVRTDDLYDHDNILVQGLIDKDMTYFIIDSRLTNEKRPPKIECFDDQGCSLTNVNLFEKEEKLYSCNIEYERGGHYIIFASYGNIQIKGFPYLVQCTKFFGNIDISQSNETRGKIKETKKYCTILDMTEMYEKCFEVLNQELTNALEISVKEVYQIQTEENKSIHIVSQQIQFKDNKDKLYQWVDKTFGLILLGSSLNGFPIFWKTFYTIIVDMNDIYSRGILGIYLEGPSDTNINCVQNKSGQCLLTYFPTSSGQYKLNVTFNEVPIDGSPFKIDVYDPLTSLSNSYLPNCESSNNEVSNNHLNNVISKAFLPYIYSPSARLHNPLLNSDDCNSNHSSTSSFDSSNSIISGIYLAKIKKAKNKEDLVTSEIIQSPLIFESKISSNCSSNTEVDNISWNYEESLNNFYEHLLSAFKTLIIIDLLYNSVEGNIETLNKITVLKKFYSEESSTFTASYLSTSLEKSITLPDVLGINLSGESVTLGCSNFVTQTVSCKNYSPIGIKDTIYFCFDNMKYKLQSIDTLTSPIEHENTELNSEDTYMSLTLLECYKSITVDVMSSSTRVPLRDTKYHSIKASAEVICEPLSKTFSTNLSEQISVYKNHIFNQNHPCSQEDSNYEMNSEISFLDIKSKNDEISTMEDLSSCFRSKIDNSYRHIKLQKRNKSDSEVISCHKNKSRHVKNKRIIKMYKRHILKVNRYRVTSTKYSTFNYFNKAINDDIKSELSPLQKGSSEQIQIRQHVVTCISLKYEKIKVFKDIECFQKLGCQIYIRDEYDEQLIERITFVTQLSDQVNSVHHSVINWNYNKKIMLLYENNNISELILLETLINHISQMTLNELKKYSKPSRKYISNRIVSDRETQTPFNAKIFKCCKNKSYEFVTINNQKIPRKCQNYQIPHKEQSSGSELLCNKSLTKYFNNKDEYYFTKPDSSSSEIKDISSAVETLVDAITEISKNHVILHPSKNNIKRMEKLTALLPNLLTFGREKKLSQINYLTDELESILVRNNNQTGNDKAINEIIKSIKKCICMNKDYGINVYQRNITKYASSMDKINDFAAAEVFAVGSALEYGTIDLNNKFIIYTKCTIVGSLSISFEGPSKASIKFLNQNVGVYVICYRVDIPGQYICSITYNRINIKNSPFTIKVSLKCTIKKKENSNNTICITQNDGVSSIMLPVYQSIVFHIRNQSISTLSCFITGPGDISGYLPIENDLEGGLIHLFTVNTGVYNLDFFNSLGERIGKSHTLNFTRMEEEYHSKTIHCNIDLLSEKQEQISLTYPNILAYGEGLSSGNVNSKNMFFLVISHECGFVLAKDPCLHVTIDGPSKVELSCTDDNLGYTFWYIAFLSGIYYISITYSNNHHIIGSPYKVEIRPSLNKY